MNYKVLTVVLLLFSTICNYSFASANVSEKVFDFGVLNGAIQEGGMVKINRAIPDPVIYRLELKDKKSGSIVIRDATARMASNGAATITIQNTIPDEKEALYLTINTTMFVDSKKHPLEVSSRGNDVIVNMPESGEILELRSDSPLELQVPVSFKGNIRIEMQIEDELSY